METYNVSEEFKSEHEISSREILLQQGDVLLLAVDNIPDHATPEPHAVLARGEATGHAHVPVGEGVAVLEERWEGRRFLSAPKGARIVHEEHEELQVPAGIFEIRIVREYDHFNGRAQEVWD